jgi:hypothetical protein
MYDWLFYPRPLIGGCTLCRHQLLYGDGWHTNASLYREAKRITDMFLAVLSIVLLIFSFVPIVNVGSRGGYLCIHNVSEVLLLKWYIEYL